MDSPPKWDRNATWGAGANGGGSSRAPLKQAFSSFTRSSGQRAAADLAGSGASTGASTSSGSGTATRSSTPAPDGGPADPKAKEADGVVSSLVQDLDGKATASRRSSISKGLSSGERTGVAYLSARPEKTGAEGKTAEVAEDSPLQRAQKNPYHRPLPGHPGNLTTTQARALLDLTLLLKKDGALHDPTREPPSYQETQLLFNVEAARTMYLKSEAWRKEFEIDRLCREFVFEEEEAVAASGWRMYFHKVDKLGRPIFVQDLSNLDTTALFQTTTPERILQKFAVTLELAVRHRYEACTLASERWVDDNMMVVNVQGLGLSTFWAMKDQLQQLLSVLDQNFPELSGRVQIINAPWMFSSIWSLLKGWLPTATVDKIDIAGSAYQPLIFKFIRKEDWPKHLGGECCCEDAAVDVSSGGSGGGARKKTSDGCLRSDVGPWNKVLASGTKQQQQQA